MATATTITELYNLVGYWDDSGSVRVAGSAEGEDVYCDWVGVSDRGATDNILYPAPSTRQIVHVVTGATAQGRLYRRSTAGHANPFRLTGGGTWDCKGYGALPAALKPAGTPSTNIAIDGGACVIDIAAVTNSAPTSGVNLLTLIQRSTDDAGVQLVADGTVTGASADNISTKGLSGTAATGE